MATARDLLNNVLRGLRRDIVTTTSTTNSYNLLLLQFLNVAKERMEEQWDWHALRTTVTLTVSAGTTEYALTVAGPADVDVGDRARLLYERPSRTSDEYGATTETSDRVAGSLPQVFDVTDGTEHRLIEISPEQMERLHFTDNDEQNVPTHFSLTRDADNMIAKLYPTPSGARTIKMRFVIPQAEIPSSSMTSYTLSIPSRPCWLSALIMALEERGEEAGRAPQSIDREYQDALYLALDRERLDSDNTSYPV